MSQQEALKSLETLLESFLQQVVAHKEHRLEVLDGINRLDDIARASNDGFEITDRVGEWFARHNRWLSEGGLRQADVSRIGGILGEIRNRLRLDSDAPPAMHKISAEIDRWTIGSPAAKKEKIVLHRGPETAPPPSSAVAPKDSDVDSVERFRRFFDRARDLFEDFAGNKPHVLSVLDDALRSAAVQKSKDALILSAFMIYYLKQIGYKVEPFVQRLKQAEQLQKEFG